MKNFVSCLLVIALASVSHAFLCPRASCVSQSRNVEIASSYHSIQMKLGFNDNIQRKYQSRKQLSSDDNNDPSNTINIAVFSDNNNHFEQALSNHPFCQMTGVTFSIDYITITKEPSLSKSELDVLQATDIACFSTISSVKTYLSKLDAHFKIDPELPQEERRKLPNKPDLIADIIGGTGGNRDLVAACPLTETARECLNSGRWLANNIYYPKDGKAVELKTQSLEDGDVNDESEEDVEIDVDVWAASVIQAAGDVLERKFWGGGW
jgi:hypothetical protein